MNFCCYWTCLIVVWPFFCIVVLLLLVLVICQLKAIQKISIKLYWRQHFRAIFLSLKRWPLNDDKPIQMDLHLNGKLCILSHSHSTDPIIIDGTNSTDISRFHLNSLAYSDTVFSSYSISQYPHSLINSFRNFHFSVFKLLWQIRRKADEMKLNARLTNENAKTGISHWQWRLYLANYNFTNYVFITDSESFSVMIGPLHSFGLHIARFFPWAVQLKFIELQ